MTRAAVAMLLVFACAASSEPRPREAVPPAPPPGSASATPPDALPPVTLASDASDVVAFDAPTSPRDRPVTPRTIYPILKFEADVSGTRLTIGIGKNQGVNDTWQAHLVDRDGVAMRRGDLKLVAIDATTTVAVSRRSLDDMPRDAQVHIDNH